MLNKIKDLLQRLKLKKEKNKKLKAEKKKKLMELGKSNFSTSSIPYGTYVFQFRGINKNAVGRNTNYTNRDYNNLSGRYVEQYVHDITDAPSCYIFKVDKVIGSNTIVCEFLKCTYNIEELSEEELFKNFTSRFLNLPASCILMDQINAYKDI